MACLLGSCGDWHSFQKLADLELEGLVRLPGSPRVKKPQQTKPCPYRMSSKETAHCGSSMG